MVETLYGDVEAELRLRGFEPVGCKVGNYLTTLNQPVEKDLQMLKDLGLDPNWDKHGFSDQDESECGSCASAEREAEPAMA